MILTLLILGATLSQAPATPAPPATRPVAARPAATKQAAAKQATAKQASAKGAAASAAALATQVMLDRAGFSPGALDGRMGKNTEKALAAYKEQGRDVQPSTDPVTQYTITEEDATGPYVPDLPTDMMQQAKLTALGYRTPLEALSERFHSAPALLERLNPGAHFAAGDSITVPNVEAMVIPAPRVPAAASSTSPKPAAGPARGATPARAPADTPVKPDVTVTVSKSMSALTVTDAAGQVIFYAPVTTGSEHDPLPIGEWKVNGVQFNPTFRYNPALFWDADPAHTKASIPAGPNNPVGLVWVDITKEHYGLHGTPEPSLIGRVESHGCVRLTNWDALRVAGLVKPGTRVVFTE